MSKKEKRQERKLDYSKRLTNDMRALLWVVTCGGFALAFCCVFMGYVAELPWIVALVGLPWTAWGTAASFYMNLAKSDHREGGITYELAKLEHEQAQPEDDDVLAGQIGFG